MDMMGCSEKSTLVGNEQFTDKRRNRKLHAMVRYQLMACVKVATGKMIQILHKYRLLSK